ncbi:hypothetical protein [Jannaschia aquimarina]|uniref:hypothetical protein n=1 Tax=Jannaschia aquimarina TaxID=935700 RepID=UPI00113219E3|nr:hypothetical protein [Jannaschia aquimarina]
MRITVKITGDPFSSGNFLLRTSLAEVKKYEGEKLLLELREDNEGKKANFEFIVASFRHGEADRALYESGQPVLCSLIATTKHRALSEDPLDTSWWRGGNAMVGSIQKTTLPSFEVS